MLHFFMKYITMRLFRNIKECSVTIWDVSISSLKDIFLRNYNKKTDLSLKGSNKWIEILKTEALVIWFCKKV